MTAIPTPLRRYEDLQTGEIPPEARAEIERLRTALAHAIDNEDRERTEHDELRAGLVAEIERLRVVELQLIYVLNYFQGGIMPTDLHDWHIHSCAAVRKPPAAESYAF